MASSLKAKFEDMARLPPPGHQVEEQTIETERIIQEEIRKKTWSNSGNSGGGHTGHDGKFFADEKILQEEKKIIEVEVKKKTTFAKPPPPAKSFSDLP